MPAAIAADRVLIAHDALFMCLLLRQAKNALVVQKVMVRYLWTCWIWLGKGWMGGGAQVQRAAREGRETGSENHAGIGEVGVGHHAAVDLLPGAVDQRLHQAPRQAGRCGFRGGFAGLAVMPGIEPPARLAAEVVAGDAFGQAARRLVLARKLASGGQRNIQP